tara:strand:+ start:126 stop:623 length:498 start_codon:yes stop_codon:yes gene_type:complete
MKLKKKPLILIVDDDPLMVETIVTIVEESKKYETITAVNGYEALEKLDQCKRWGGLAKNKIACIVLDIKMPHMNGLEFLDAWRKSELFFKKIPIVLLTAYEDKEIWTQAALLDKGMVSEYFKKPIEDYTQFTDTLDRILFNHENEFMKDIIREKARKEVLKYDVE